MNIYIYISRYIYMNICIHIHIRAGRHSAQKADIRDRHESSHIYIYESIYLYISAYIYIYIFIHVHVHTGCHSAQTAPALHHDRVWQISLVCDWPTRETVTEVRTYVNTYSYQDIYTYSYKDIYINRYIHMNLCIY